ncbi:hypothetical protein LguiB_001231 [Lonicera macranthoides]
MSSNKKGLLKILTTGCGCGKPKPTDIYQPKPRKDSINPSTHHFHRSMNYNSSITSSELEQVDPDFTSTTFSPFNISETENDPASSRTTASPYKKICPSSDAVVKDSDDPYEDFRQSMLQMILERQIYSKEELKELLNCFLELNSPAHHEVIVQAFMEICNGVICKG